MQNKQYYIDQFISLLKPWRVISQDKTWYRDRFHFRLEFTFGTDRRNSFYSQEWRDIISFLDQSGFKYRRRAESTCVLFTSDCDLLDAMLAKEEWSKHIIQVNYADEHYLKEFANHAGIDAVTDIKFVKHQPEHCYQVTLGGFDWHKESDLRLTITEYLAKNKSDFLFKGYEQEIIEAKAKGKRNTTYGSPVQVFHGFKFYAKTVDDILMIHLMAPGKVSKIVKFMEK